MRVGLIGVGHVGASVAAAVLQTGAAQELLLHDRDGARAEGEAMDLAHGAPYYPRSAVRAVALDEAVDADVVVFAAGRNGRPDETRLQLLAQNLQVAGELGQRLRGCRGVVVMVSNPVDVLTSAVQATSGLPAARVLGTGTMLDTARLRHLLGARLGLNPNSVHAHVLGEHGDSEFVHWSAAQVGGAALRDLPGWASADEDRVSEQVRRAAYEIIRRKGVTNQAIGLVTADLVCALLRDERRVLTVSRLQDGLPGLTDVALSLPAVIGRDGAATVVSPRLDAIEDAALMRSAEVLRQARRSVVG